MLQKAETSRLLKTAGLSAALAMVVKTPFVLIYLIFNLEALLMAGEIYAITLLVLSMIALIGATGAMNQERAVNICRLLYSTMFFR